MHSIKRLINKLLMHEGLKRYGANTAWLFAEKIIRMLLGLLIGIWLARYLEPELFGLLSYIQSFVYLFIVFASLGLDSIVIRELVKRSDESNVILGTAFILKLATVVIVLPLICLAIHLLYSDNEVGLLIMIMALTPLFQTVSIIDFYFQAKVQSKYVAISNILVFCLSSVLKVVLIYLKAPLIIFVFANIFDAAMLSVFFVLFYHFKSKKQMFFWRFDKKIAKQLLKDSLPVLISILMIAIYSRTDQIMIGKMLNHQALGYYSSAVKLNEIWSFFPVVLCSSMFPAIINAKTVCKQEYEKRLLVLYALMIWLSIFACIFISLFNKIIIVFTFGEAYLGAKTALTILAWSNFFVFFTTAWVRYVVAENRQKELLYFDVLAVLINIALNIILIPSYGIIGASLATALAVPCAHIIIFIFWKRQRYILFYFVKALFLKF